MHFHKQLKRMERIDYLIHLRSTGRPSELAQRLCISPSQVNKIKGIVKEEIKEFNNSFSLC
jgi:hypothetical protein